MTAISLAPFRPVETNDLVRIGSPNDGGYVINARCLARAELLVGLGISTDWQFETDFQGRNPACRVVGVDRTVSPGKLQRRAVRYFGKAAGLFCLGQWSAARSKAARAVEFLQLSREFVAFFMRRGNMFVQRHITDVASDTTTAWDNGPLADILTEHPRRDLSVFVKMDIEGSEYDVLPAVLRSADRVNGMVVEFHNCGEQWPALERLLRDIERHFYVVHVHGNNYSPIVDGTSVPRTIELTFLNKKLVPEAARASTRAYPIEGLDAPCDPLRPDYRLTF